MKTPVIAIHGGAGTITRSALSAADEASYHRELHTILTSAQAVLTAGGSALDAVSEAVRLLEDCPLFNAGKGAVYTRAGTHELDAAIMDGATLMAGAVANITCVRNPVLAARAVMEKVRTSCWQVAAPMPLHASTAWRLWIRPISIPMRATGSGCACASRAA